MHNQSDSQDELLSKSIAERSCRKIHCQFHVKSKAKDTLEKNCRRAGCTSSYAENETERERKRLKYISFS